MAFWDKVNENLKKALDEGIVAIKEGAKIATEKSGELASVGKLKYEAYNAHKEAEKCLAELGGLVFDMAKPPFENPLSNSEVMAVVEKIKLAEKEIQEVEEKIKKAKEDGEDDDDKEEKVVED